MPSFIRPTDLFARGERLHDVSRELYSDTDREEQIDKRNGVEGYIQIHQTSDHIHGTHRHRQHDAECRMYLEPQENKCDYERSYDRDDEIYSTLSDDCVVLLVVRVKAGVSVDLDNLVVLVHLVRDVQSLLSGGYEGLRRGEDAMARRETTR